MVTVERIRDDSEKRILRCSEGNRGWYLKDDWSYTGYDWNMGYESYQTLPSATLDYDNGEGEYKTIFEWIFSDGIDNILPQ